jgi:ABC-type branched-subunit amino acid transport system permease subunit/ABC-type branched-subunit amino acid transport system ATPase component
VKSLLRPPVILAAALLVALAVPFTGLSDFYIHLCVLMVIYAIFAMSLDILMGYAGLPSLGHAAFFGLGAYAIGIGTVKLGLPWWAAVVVAIALCTAMGLLFGVIALRTHGLYFLLITLALGQLLWGAANRWGSFTGGYNGLPGIQRPFEWLVPTVNFYLFSLALLVALAWLMHRLVTSPFGISLKALSDSETRLQALGYDVWLAKYVAFIVTGVIAGVAGAVNAFYNGFVSPRDLSIAMSAEAILMVILGGAGTLWGALLGAAIIVALRNLLSVYFDDWLIVLGAFFIVAVLYAPDGVVGWFADVAGRSRKHADEPTGQESPAGAGARLAFVAAGAHSRRSAQLSSGSGPPALETRKLSKNFGGIVAVRDVDMVIRPGERVALLGPNGAGKTTLFHMISGALKPSAGSIFLFGRPITRVPPHKRARAGIGRTFQITNLFPRLTVRDHLRFCAISVCGYRFAMLRRADRIPEVERRAAQALKGIGLWPHRDRLVRELSYGHQRQLEVAMAVALEPRVLLLDEPAAGLSPAEIGPIVEMIAGLDPSITVIIVEHDLDVALAVSERVIVFNHGELVTEGAPTEIRGNAEVQRIYLGGRRA